MELCLITTPYDISYGIKSNFPNKIIFMLQSQLNFSKKGISMNGKILGDGVIRGNDGKRYIFNANEIKNAQGKSIGDLVGSEVDFEISNGGGR